MRTPHFDGVTSYHAAMGTRYSASGKWQMSKEQPRSNGDKLAIGGDADADPVKHVIEHVYVRPEGN